MEFFKQTQYENYEVSNHGTVRNTKTGKVLKGGESKSSGYRKVSLSVKGSKKTVTREVHRLVAETFLGLHKGLVVDHMDLSLI
ncbi:NUMOD4 domain-containing protein, partial [Escherichia coli]|uniref:NUMOD4 domain-containing protein n=1 Tax=Escherichia coli TaxID=562 RepID=UPI002552E63F